MVGKGLHGKPPRGGRDKGIVEKGFVMVSDEERRNMASSLRHDAAYCEGSLSEWWGRLQFIVLDEEDFPNPREVFEGLADLIDPEGGSDED